MTEAPSDPMLPLLVDSHCHLDFADFEAEGVAAVVALVAVAEIGLARTAGPAVPVAFTVVAVGLALGETANRITRAVLLLAGRRAARRRCAATSARRSCTALVRKMTAKSSSRVMSSHDSRAPMKVITKRATIADPWISKPTDFHFSMPPP